ncbi:hypothetical protein RRG08_023867 [Elysia crispata]|uniref:Uncharacterized protein n=1 Tax=Elysia crispata TaxID=231223 RepID=A0AAE1AT49_9GAST|nr:hypothetical protein RRG08_023867 [Elysia crispata]
MALIARFLVISKPSLEQRIHNHSRCQETLSLGKPQKQNHRKLQKTAPTIPNHIKLHPTNPQKTTETKPQRMTENCTNHTEPHKTAPHRSTEIHRKLQKTAPTIPNHIKLHPTNPQKNYFNKTTENPCKRSQKTPATIHRKPLQPSTENLCKHPQKTTLTKPQKTPATIHREPLQASPETDSV